MTTGRINQIATRSMQRAIPPTKESWDVQFFSAAREFSSPSSPLSFFLNSLLLESPRLSAVRSLPCVSSPSEGFEKSISYKLYHVTNTPVPISFSFTNYDPPARRHATVAFTKPANVGTTPPDSGLSPNDREVSEKGPRRSAVQ